MGTAHDWRALVHRMVYHHKGKLIAHIGDDEARRIADWLTDERPIDVPGVRIGPVPTGRWP